MNFVPVETQAQRRLRQALDHFIALLAASAQKLARSRAQSQAAAASLHALATANPELRQVSFSHRAGYLLLLLFLPAVYLLDFLLFGPTAEYFARRSFPASPGLVALACLVIPAGFLLVEVAIAMQLFFARQEAAKFRDTYDHVLWLLLGLFFALVMPSQVLATLLAAQPAVSSPRLALVFHAQLLGLVLLTFVAHVAVLFGGRLAHEAKAYLAFSLQRAWLRAQQQRAEMRAAQALAAFETAAAKYWQLLLEWNAQFSPRLAPGPFDRSTQKLFAERFGDAPFPAQASPAAPPADAAPSTALATYDAPPSAGLCRVTIALERPQ